MHQVAAGIKDSARVIELDLQMSIDAGEGVDEIWMDGVPDIHVVTHGVHGDLSTQAIVANAVRRVIRAEPDLITMADLPSISVG